MIKALDYLRRLFVEAKTKLTTYLAIATAMVAQLAAHAEDILNSIPQLKTFLPASSVLSLFLMKWVVSGLGILTVWARVRRMLRQPAA